MQEAEKQPRDPPDYTEARNLLNRGFLCAAVELSISEDQSLTIILKSLNSREHDLIKTSALASKPAKKLSNATYLTLLYSVFLLDGENVLANRPKYFPTLYKAFQSMPSAELAKIMKEIMNLAERVAKEQDRVFRYVHSDDARMDWAVMGNEVMQPKFTGVQGTEILGLSDYQRLWVLHNQGEDQKKQFRVLFNNSLFLVSAFSSKAVQRIRAQMESEDEYEESRRQRLVAGEDLSDPNLGGGGIKTVEQLKEEMDRAVRGEKDFHDLVVEEYEKELKEKVRQRIKAELLLQQRVKKEGMGFLSMTQGILSEEERAALLRLAPTGAAPASSDVSQAEDEARLYATITGKSYEDLRKEVEAELKGSAVQHEIKAPAAQKEQINLGSRAPTPARSFGNNQSAAPVPEVQRLPQNSAVNTMESTPSIVSGQGYTPPTRGYLRPTPLPPQPTVLESKVPEHKLIEGFLSAGVSTLSEEEARKMLGHNFIDKTSYGPDGKKRS